MEARYQLRQSPLWNPEILAQAWWRQKSRRVPDHPQSRSADTTALYASIRQ
jgi:hypothetical protein